jgi:hypothetical protein
VRSCRIFSFSFESSTFKLSHSFSLRQISPGTMTIYLRETREALPCPRYKLLPCSDGKCRIIVIRNLQEARGNKFSAHREENRRVLLKDTSIDLNKSFTRLSYANYSLRNFLGFLCLLTMQRRDLDMLTQLTVYMGETKTKASNKEFQVKKLF